MASLETTYKKSIPSELELITEGGNTGWRMLGRDPANYGDVGFNAVDFSWSITPSSTLGATGLNAFAIGANTTASGASSFAAGSTSEASGYYSSAWGVGNIANSYGMFVLGRYATEAGGQSDNSWVSTDELLKIGNGTGVGDRADALVMLKNGETSIFSSSTSYGLSINSTGANATGLKTSSIYRVSEGILESSDTASIGYAEFIRRRTTGTAANGIGVGKTFYVENATGSDRPVLIFKASLLDATAANGQFDIDVIEANTPTNILRLKGNGEATLPNTTVSDITTAGVKSLTTKEYVEDILTNQKTGSFTAGETVVAGDLCYFKSDGKMWKTDADAESTSQGLLGIATAGITAESSGTFLMEGVYTTTGLTAASEYYISATAAGWTATKPSTTNQVVRSLGYALSTTQLYFNPDNYYTVIP